MRIKSILNYFLLSTKKAAIIFTSIYIIIPLLIIVMLAAFSANIADGSSNASFSLSGFSIFIFIVGILTATKDMSFLNSQMLARKESFISMVLFFLISAVALSVVSDLLFYSSKALFGLFHINSSDVRDIAAPGVNVFSGFIYNICSLILSASSGALIGVFFKRFRWIAVGVSIALVVLLITSAATGIGIHLIGDFFRFFFCDATSIWILCLKLLGLALVPTALSYLIIRRMPTV